MRNEELALRTDTLRTDNALTPCVDGVTGTVAGTVGTTLVVARQEERHIPAVRATTRVAPTRK